MENYEPKVIRWEDEEGVEALPDEWGLSLQRILDLRAVVAVPKVCGECGGTREVGYCADCDKRLELWEGPDLFSDLPDHDLCECDDPDGMTDTCETCDATGYAHSEVTVPVRDALLRAVVAFDEHASVNPRWSEFSPRDATIYAAILRTLAGDTDG